VDSHLVSKTQTIANQRFITSYSGIHASQELFKWQTNGTRLDSVTDMAYSWFYWRNLPSSGIFGS